MPGLLPPPTLPPPPSPPLPPPPPHLRQSQRSKFHTVSCIRGDVAYDLYSPLYVGVVATGTLAHAPHKRKLHTMFFQVGLLFVIFLLLWYLAFHGENLRGGGGDRNDGGGVKRRRLMRQAALGNATKPVVRTVRHSNDAVDCSVDVRYCADDKDCRILCRNYKRMIFRCDGVRSTCEPVYIKERQDPDAGKDDNCDAKRGEYAMLAGYTTLGTAIWQCIQLYQQFRDRTTFCQNGRFEMDATVREPSYRDCTCPEDTIRSVFAHAASTATFQLPHCVKADQWHLYRLSMKAVPEEEEEEEDD